MFEEDTEIFNVNVAHDADKLAEFPEVSDQFAYRRDTILNVLKEKGITLDGVKAYAGRGGGLQSCAGGTYRVNDALLNDARNGTVGRHPAVLGSQIAHEFATTYGGEAFIVNPPDIDELCDEARITGLADIYRESRVHALNQKETAIRVAKDLGTTYEAENFIVAHIGGGVSITAHEKGKAIDNTDIINGEGPMTPTRAGALPAVQFMDLCYSGKWTRDEMYKRITKEGGFVSHLGTSDAREVTKMIAEGDEYAALVYDAFIYQIIKNIGSMAAVLSGDVKAIILTGGIANDKDLVAKIKEKVSFVAPVEVRAGEFEMEALASGALRVLHGEEEAREYTGVPVFQGFKRK